MLISEGQNKTYKKTYIQIRFWLACESVQSDQPLLPAGRGFGVLATWRTFRKVSFQTMRMHRLIWAFAGCTSDCSGFVVSKLIYLLLAIKCHSKPPDKYNRCNIYLMGNISCTFKLLKDSISNKRLKSFILQALEAYLMTGIYHLEAGDHFRPSSTIRASRNKFLWK